METRPATQSPWALLALGITVILLGILTVQSMLAEPPLEKRTLEVIHPVGPVDDLFPVRWSGELPEGDYKFRVTVREDRVHGQILVQSDLLPRDLREWTPPEDTNRRTWGRIRTKVWAVLETGEDGVDDDEVKMIRAPDIVAWER